MHRSMNHHQHLESGMQANQIGHIVCSCCDITLMYAFGAASVKCAVCNTVTHVNHTTLTHPSAQQGPSNSSAGVSAGASPRPQQSHQTVVIVNPPTLDAEGNEVSAAFWKRLLQVHPPVLLCCLLIECTRQSSLADTHTAARAISAKLRNSNMYVKLDWRMTWWQPWQLCAGGRLCSWCDNHTRTEISRTKKWLKTACKTASSRQSYIGQQLHSMHLLFKPCCLHGMAWQRQGVRSVIQQCCCVQKSRCLVNFSWVYHTEWSSIRSAYSASCHTAGCMQIWWACLPR